VDRIGDIKDKNILLLQGPMGSFFQRLDLRFRQGGAKTFKIGFNAGDWFFSNRDNYIPYRGTKEEWRDFIRLFLEEKEIHKIFLFGDCRFYQKIAIEESMKLGIEVFVFEEGYIRPDFVTMERYGVNNYSKISRDPNFYRNLPKNFFHKRLILPANPKYWKMALSATTYYILAKTFKFRYPHYEHHRELAVIKEGFWGIRSFYRKYLYKVKERGLIEKLSDELSKKYYFVPLQTYNDFQLREHSPFSSIEDFIQRVLDSFAHHAPKESYLVIKHHPMDRGRKNYEKFIHNLAEELGVQKRVIVIHDLHLPTCLKHAIGTITINSTVGLSSLYHNIPTITLGDAFYDIEDLTCKDMPLERFWREYKEPDPELFKKFRYYLIETTQINGSFYGRFPVEFNPLQCPLSEKDKGAYLLK
jgi:capsular polysaccharide export protein